MSTAGEEGASFSPPAVGSKLWTLAATSGGKWLTASVDRQDDSQPLLFCLRYEGPGGTKQELVRFVSRSVLEVQPSSRHTGGGKRRQEAAVLPADAAPEVRPYVVLPADKKGGRPPKALVEARDAAAAAAAEYQQRRNGRGGSSSGDRGSPSKKQRTEPPTAAALEDHQHGNMQQRQAHAQQQQAESGAVNGGNGVLFPGSKQRLSSKVPGKVPPAVDGEGHDLGRAVASPLGRKKPGAGTPHGKRHIADVQDQGEASAAALVASAAGVLLQEQEQAGGQQAGRGAGAAAGAGDEQQEVQQPQQEQEQGMQGSRAGAAGPQQAVPGGASVTTTSPAGKPTPHRPAVTELGGSSFRALATVPLDAAGDSPEQDDPQPDRRRLGRPGAPPTSGRQQAAGPGGTAQHKRQAERQTGQHPGRPHSRSSDAAAQNNRAGGGGGGRQPAQGPGPGNRVGGASPEPATIGVGVGVGNVAEPTPPAEPVPERPGDVACRRFADLLPGLKKFKDSITSAAVAAVQAGQLGACKDVVRCVLDRMTVERVPERRVVLFYLLDAVLAHSRKDVEGCGPESAVGRLFPRAVGAALSQLVELLGVNLESARTMEKTLSGTWAVQGKRGVELSLVQRALAGLRERIAGHEAAWGDDGGGTAAAALVMAAGLQQQGSGMAAGMAAAVAGAAMAMATAGPPGSLPSGSMPHSAWRPGSSMDGSNAQSMAQGGHPGHPGHSARSAAVAAAAAAVTNGSEAALWQLVRQTPLRSVPVFTFVNVKDNSKVKLTHAWHPDTWPDYDSLPPLPPSAELDQVAHQDRVAAAEAAEGLTPGRGGAPVSPWHLPRLMAAAGAAGVGAGGVLPWAAAAHPDGFPPAAAAAAAEQQRLAAEAAAAAAASHARRFLLQQQAAAAARARGQSTAAAAEADEFDAGLFKEAAGGVAASGADHMLLPLQQQMAGAMADLLQPMVGEMPWASAAGAGGLGERQPPLPDQPPPLPEDGWPLPPDEDGGGWDDDEDFGPPPLPPHSPPRDEYEMETEGDTPPPLPPPEDGEEEAAAPLPQPPLPPPQQQQQATQVQQGQGQAQHAPATHVPQAQEGAPQGSGAVPGGVPGGVQPYAVPAVPPGFPGWPGYGGAAAVPAVPPAYPVPQQQQQQQQAPGGWPGAAPAMAPPQQHPLMPPGIGMAPPALNPQAAMLQHQQQMQQTQMQMQQQMWAAQQQQHQHQQQHHQHHQQQQMWAAQQQRQQAAAAAAMMAAGGGMPPGGLPVGAHMQQPQQPQQPQHPLYSPALTPLNPALLRQQQMAAAAAAGGMPAPQQLPYTPSGQTPGQTPGQAQPHLAPPTLPPRAT